MSLWHVKKHKWQAKICRACQKIKKLQAAVFFYFELCSLSSLQINISPIFGHFLHE